jgi:hypothetical protein
LELVDEKKLTARKRKRTAGELVAAAKQEPKKGKRKENTKR